MVMLWIGLVQIIGTNATATVDGDSREGRSMAPPAVQLVQAMWTSYLAYIVLESGLQPSGYVKWSRDTMLSQELYLLLGLPYALILAKLLFKYYAWYKATQSLALGRNPRLIVGYMEQLQYGAHHAELASHYVPPPLIVMREGTVLVEKQPHGYSLTGMNNDGLVTIDRVWELDDTVLPEPAAQHKDLCLSFALFKLLRCRFARYTVSEAGFMKVGNFMRHMLLQDSDDERVLGVIAHELSFLHDYYYTSLPVSYSQSFLPMLSVSISLSSIGYCLFLIIFLVGSTRTVLVQGFYTEQISCSPVHCNQPDPTQRGSVYTEVDFGTVWFDAVEVYILVMLVLLVEAREIASYICSSWAKVALICGYTRNTCWQKSPTIRKCVGYVLRTRCNLIEHWVDEMNQCSVLLLHQRRKPVALLRRLLHRPDEKKKVPKAVKTAVVSAVRRFDPRISRLRSNSVTPLQLRVNNNELLWTFQAPKGVADAMLVCHVATSILQVRSRRKNKPLSNHEIAATHISQYCAYLVAYCPELLPDDAAWCRSLYKAVKKDAARVLRDGGGRVSTATPEVEDQQLLKLLSEQSKHRVLKDGAELGRLLAELPAGEEVAWKTLAEFWSDTLVSVAAACDNIDDHAEAVARGGELVTLLWALLAHVGSVDDDTADAAATYGAPDAV
ncbi:uncharacterized protein LOC125539240 [Triticum urartu]|uniref:uncharacterized protein LOC125539240 n=1 Tax=Triticum urartu TaxID=4572 RepID=UPI00204385FB|nr:uncharacterized protein LOC125539240 [Triticum urartu]